MSAAPTRLAFAGEPGAFAEDAVLAYLPGAVAVPVATFRDVFVAVGSGSPAGAVDGGVLPIENVVGGTVVEVEDLLLEHELTISGEVVVPVRLCLAALPGESVDELDRVYSHVQALGQAEQFLRTRRWTLLTSYNTAGAGRLIAERGERRAAAVLSPRAAALFGLEILVPEIQTVRDNRTRFLVVALPERAPRLRPSPRLRDERPLRTTLVLGVPNEPGSLVRCLQVFADAGVNMSKLESRPSRERAWEYVFWIDLDLDAGAPGAAATLEALRARATFVRVLGSYPRATEA